MCVFISACLLHATVCLSSVRIIFSNARRLTHQARSLVLVHLKLVCLEIRLHLKLVCVKSSYAYLCVRSQVVNKYFMTISRDRGHEP